MNVCGSLFSGVGLLDYGLHLAGFEHRWFAEADEFRRRILERRWPGAHVYGDVRAVGHDADRVDVVAGGFPCKGASTAGKRTGFDHPETRLWREMARAVGELRPRYVLVENVANILGLHDGAVWGTVLGDLAALGYDVEWDCLPAAAFGAPHLRDRVFALAADADGAGWSAGWSWLGAGSGIGEAWRRDEPSPTVEDAPHSDGGAVGPGPLRRGERGRDQAAAADPSSERREARATEAGPLGRAASRGADAPADAGSDRVRVEPEPERRSDPTAEPRPTDAFPWGEYEPAIRRWERALRPAPEPLIRRVDDRRARWVERSRLSALGDGVLVQAGYYVGTVLMQHITTHTKGSLTG